MNYLREWLRWRRERPAPPTYVEGESLSELWQSFGNSYCLWLLRRPELRR